jgi:hypothetical protein
MVRTMNREELITRCLCLLFLQKGFMLVDR